MSDTSSQVDRARFPLSLPGTTNPGPTSEGNRARLCVAGSWLYSSKRSSLSWFPLGLLHPYPLLPPLAPSPA